MAAPNLLTWAQSLIQSPTYAARIPQNVRENITRLGYYINSEDFDPTALTPFINGMLAKVGKQLITGFQWDDDKFSTFYKKIQRNQLKISLITLQNYCFRVQGNCKLRKS